MWTPVRFCGAPLSGHSLISACRARQLLCGSESRRHGTFLSASCTGLHEVLAGAAADVSDRGGIFSDYAYFSSYSDSWLAHAKAYTDKMHARFKLNASSQVIEIASNDGYLLQYFKEAGYRARCGTAKNVAEVAVAKAYLPWSSFRRGHRTRACRRRHTGGLLLE